MSAHALPSSPDSTSSPPPPDSKIVAANSIIYWNNVSADVNGMLGGYPQVSRIDLQGSKTFITKLRRWDTKNRASSEQQPPTKKLRLAVDCGAGVGRVTEGLLAQVCDTVDIVEPVEKFATVLASGPLKEQGKVGDVYVESLERWTPCKKYDLIWNQWCLGHLKDMELIAYLKRASQFLAEGGWIVVKENLTTRSTGGDLFDELDYSVTRTDKKFKLIFTAAGLDLIKAELQTGFPKTIGLYPVKMYGLRPCRSSHPNRIESSQVKSAIA